MTERERTPYSFSALDVATEKPAITIKRKPAPYSLSGASIPTKEPVIQVTSIPSPKEEPRPNGPPMLYASVCCHCRKGIAQCTPCQRCSFCRLDMCTSCAPQHPADHARMLQNLQYRITMANEKWISKSCSTCKGRKRIRTTCETCQWEICTDCFLKGQPTTHAHNAFVCLKPPNTGFSLPQGATISSCTGVRHTDHCSKCSRGLSILDRINICMKCHCDFSDSGATCMSCGPACLIHAGGKKGNVTVQTQIVSDAEFIKLRGQIFRCNNCTLTWKKLDGFEYHKHKDYTLLLSAAMLENTFLKDAQNCPSRPIRYDSPSPDASGDACRVCKHYFPPSALSCCTTCLTAQRANPMIACANCKPRVIELHSTHAPAPGQMPPLLSVADQRVATARTTIAQRQAAAASAQRRKNGASLLGLGLKIGFAVIGADVGIDNLIGGGGGGGVDFGSGGAMPDFSAPSVPDMPMPDAFSGPVEGAAMDGIQG